MTSRVDELREKVERAQRAEREARDELLRQEQAELRAQVLAAVDGRELVVLLNAEGGPCDVSVCPAGGMATSRSLLLEHDARVYQPIASVRKLYVVNLHEAWAASNWSLPEFVRWIKTQLPVRVRVDARYVQERLRETQELLDVADAINKENET